MSKDADPTPPTHDGYIFIGQEKHFIQLLKIFYFRSVICLPPGDANKACSAVASSRCQLDIRDNKFSVIHRAFS